MKRRYAAASTAAVLIGALLAANMVAGCHSRTAAPAATPPPATAYEVRGVLREVSASGKVARISHEEIPGYMAAMTMEFDVANATEVQTLELGEAIAFRLNVTEEDASIDRIRKIAERPKVPEPATRKTPTTATLAPGDAVPDCELVSATGERFRLADLRGKAVALTFMFTRCPYPNFCPLMSRNFAAAQREMAGHADPRWQLLSITLDPEYDTPERLSTYSQPYQPDPAHWTFATGQLGEIRRLGAALGLAVAEGGALPDHNLRTVVIDPAGRVRRVFAGNEWTPGDLAAELRGALAERAPER